MKSRYSLILLVVILLVQAFPVLAGQYTATTFAELENSLTLAKSGDVIVLSGDITLHTGLIVSKKKITLRSAEGSVYSMTRAFGHKGTLLALLDGATLTLENVVLDSGTTSERWYQDEDLIYVGKSSLILGSGSVIQNYYGKGLIWVLGGNLTLDGGVIQDNVSEADLITMFGKSGKLVIKAGEIRNNQVFDAGVRGILRLSGGSFLMEGGAIHHNSVSRGSPIYLQDINGKAQIKGGDIFRNVGAVGAIYSQAKELTISGGTILENYGESTGAIELDPSTTGNVKIKMTGGEIANNLGDIDGVCVKSNEWRDGSKKVTHTKGSFELSGGSLRSAQYGTALYVEGPGAQATLIKGEILGALRASDDGKIVDKIKK